ncbi:MAG: lysophospholipid acyltransferase family protein [Propioniciclava sp.]
MWYTVFKVPFRWLSRWGYGGRVEGEQHIPATGGVILASNHISEIDTYVMPALIRRKVTFPAKAELFTGRYGFGSKIVAWFLRAVGQVPLDRSGGRASLDGLGPIREVLLAGGVAGIYPEGTRSPDGRLYKGKTGVARLALTAGVPVIPVGVQRTQVTRRILKVIPWADRPLIRFGEPLSFAEYAGREGERALVRWVTDEIMAGIQHQSGQVFVNGYASSVKHGGMSVEEAERRVLPRPGGGPAPEPPAVTAPPG